MDWSTPWRMANGQPLEPIPNELYLEIFEYVDNSINWTPAERIKALKGLSLICRFFHIIALPRIFASLRIQGLNDIDQMLTATSAVFCIAVTKKMESTLSLVKYVKECSLVAWKELRVASSGEAEEPEGGHDLLLRMYGTALSRFTNLQSLTITSTTLNGEILESIVKLQSLQSLSFHDIDDFDIPDDFPSELLLKPSLKLKEFSILRVLGDGMFLDIVPYITELSKIEVLTVHKVDIVTELLPFFPGSSLVKLVLPEVVEITALWDLLKISPSLEVLKIKTILTHHHHHPHHHQAARMDITQLSSSLPKLRKLACPLSMFPLVSGRRLSSVEMIPDRAITPEMAQMMAVDVVSYLRESVGTLKTMKVPLSLFMAAPPLLETFPGLRKLGLDVTHCASIISFDIAIVELAQRRVPNSLVALYFEGSFSDGPKPHQDLLSELTDIYPSLLRVRFEKANWYRVTDQDGWTRRSTV